MGNPSSLDPFYNADASFGTPQSRFAERRARVRAQLGARDCMVLAAAPELHAGPDGELRYVVDSELYYLTGYTEPEAVLVLTGADDGYTLFVRPRDRERELWTGVRGGTEAARDVFNADRALPIETLSVELSRIIADADRIFVRANSGRTDVDGVVNAALARARRARPRNARGATTLTDPGVILDEMRLHKDDEEVRLIRHAAAISIAAFQDAARYFKTGAGEWHIEAVLQGGFRMRRATGEAFPTIVGSGANATVLHYTANNDVICDGDFVLIDAGARAHMYCADITRTYALGKVSAERQTLHDIVRAAHDAAIAVCSRARPGAGGHSEALDVTIDAVDRAARSELVRGLIDLGLVDGPLDVALSRDDYKRYYPHRTCHWLGLDVHDVGSYVDAGGSPRVLEPGMVFTVEPGLYIAADDQRAPASLRGTGVRLEDDVLITNDGVDVITSALPLDSDPAASDPQRAEAIRAADAGSARV